MNPSYLNKALTVIRFVLGILFLVSGIGKLISGSDARYLVELLATEYYWLIEYANFIVITTSIIELVLAVLLIWNKLLKWALAGTLAMLIGFSSVLSYFYFQGMSVENCGCFGAFGFASGLEFTLIRNAVLILLTIIAFVLIAKTKSKQIDDTL
ncbi:MauE/DoxX family redox-associated membrane protein [Fodinibius sp.]|uniref:MauE/DoxX family redox-associated membrane protein n=1 Tax=Fodinibius sp. TaxID=1872440 RepID=UPI002ACE2984|nr:MauE/DoxX family redox-associated membrane protein [Fodinibius sp.]MDZ7658564.1 DoxX family membrane protein [Fodinibius sp.]